MPDNAFETGVRRCIPAVLVYASHRGRVLMIHRNAAGRAGDYHAGKWNGLGGKADPGESPLEAARREFREEAGIDLEADRFRPLGALTFPNFKPHKQEDWLVFVFAAECRDDEPARVVARNPEGELHWVPADDLPKLNLWPGDRHFLPHVVAKRPFIGTVWYEGAEARRAWVQAL